MTAPSLAERLEAMSAKFRRASAYGGRMAAEDAETSRLLAEAAALARRVEDRQSRTLQLPIFADRYGGHKVSLPGPCGGSGALVEVVILRPDEYWIPEYWIPLAERVRLVAEESDV